MFASKNQIKVYPETITTPIYKLQFDGCSKGNPGPAGAGAVIYKNEDEIWAASVYVGNKNTNNEAEYSGLILGLQNAISLNINNLVVEGDSLLVIKQMNKEYKVKSEKLLPLFEEAQLLVDQFENISFQHVYREKNTRADELSNLPIKTNNNNNTNNTNNNNNNTNNNNNNLHKYKRINTLALKYINELVFQ